MAAIFPSKGEMRKLTQDSGVSINKEKLTDPQHGRRHPLAAQRQVYPRPAGQEEILPVDCEVINTCPVPFQYKTLSS